MKTIDLPRLIGTAERADQMVDMLLDDGLIMDQSVVINCREVRSASDTFVQRLITRLLMDEHVSLVLVRGASDEMGDRLRDAAAMHGLEYKVQVLNAAGWIRMTQDLRVVCICDEDMINAVGCLCGSDKRDEYLRTIRSSL